VKNEHAEEPKIFLSRTDLKKLGIFQSNSSLIRAEIRGTFPKRVRLSSGLVCWVRSEIFDWIEARKAERNKHVYSDSIF
jgi:predicted DNA-binding transcriptional regulator AlpA